MRLTKKKKNFPVDGLDDLMEGGQMAVRSSLSIIGCSFGDLRLALE